MGSATCSQVSSRTHRSCAPGPPPAHTPPRHQARARGSTWAGRRAVSGQGTSLSWAGPHTESLSCKAARRGAPRSECGTARVPGDAVAQHRANRRPAWASPCCARWRRQRLWPHCAGGPRPTPPPSHAQTTGCTPRGWCRRHSSSRVHVRSRVRGQPGGQAPCAHVPVAGVQAPQRRRSRFVPAGHSPDCARLLHRLAHRREQGEHRVLGPRGGHL